MPRVLGLDWLAPDVFELRLERTGLAYRAGDCTLLVRDDGVDSRPYSFSSHPDQDELRFLVRRPAGADERGHFSVWLGNRRPGDEVGVGTPFGLFAPGRGEDEVWLATGTGVAPFLSCLRGDRPPRGARLFFGVRTPNDALLREFLEARCDTTWAFSRQGRRLSVPFPGLPIDAKTQYFLCGNGGMLDACRQGFLAAGVPARHLHEERFF